MKGSEPKTSDPGQKDSPFPAWLLRYAAQAAFASLPTHAMENDGEPGFTELNHFQDVQTAEPSESELPTGETSVD